MLPGGSGLVPAFLIDKFRSEAGGGYTFPDTPQR